MEKIFASLSRYVQGKGVLKTVLGTLESWGKRRCFCVMMLFGSW